MGTNDGRNKMIQSAETVFDILEFITEQDSAGVSEIARHLDYSKSTIHYYLKTLEQNRYVINEGGRYRIGLRLANLGANALQQHELRGVTEPLEELAAETNATAYLAVEEGGKAIFLSESGPNGQEPDDSRVGAEVHMHCTAYGKAILAHLSTDKADEILSRHGLPQHTEQTVTDRDELDQQLATVRDLGVAFAGEEQTPGESSIAAPILDESNDVLGAIGVTGPVNQIADPRKHIKARRHSGEMPELVQRWARIIGNKMTDR